MKNKNLLAVLIIIFFSSSICFSQYRGVERKPTNYINNMTKIQNEFLKKLNKATSLDTFFIPTDYAQIQDAIDIADSGDVVIIEEGLYYQHFSFEGKAIKVGSVYLIDDDTSHITKTIIDGSMLINPDSASLVYFINGEDSNSVLCGLTLQNGRGTYEVVPDFHDFRYAGGIEIYQSGATIRKNIIRNCRSISNAWMNSGAAIDCLTLPKNKTIIIEDNLIEGNEASGGNRAFGGAIEFEDISGNLIINMNILENNNIDGHQITGGAGIGILYSNSEDITISNNFIHNNSCDSRGTTRGGAIYVVDSRKVNFYNNIISNNKCLSTSSYGGGIGVGDWSQNDKIKISEIEMINNTIINNSAKKEGGGISLLNIEATIMNNIIRSNSAPPKNQLSFLSMSNPVISYSNIEGGYDGDGNIDIDPMFYNETYCLLTQDSSPCIDSGNPNPRYNDITNQTGDSTIYPALGTTRNDMGAFGGPYSKWAEMSIIPADPATSIRGNFEFIPEEFSLSQNYPNPFNPATIIQYSIPVAALSASTSLRINSVEVQNVSLKVYDILGREVATLVNEKQKPGNYEVTWNAVNVPSGVYFYKLSTGASALRQAQYNAGSATGFVETKKMILLK